MIVKYSSREYSSDSIRVRMIKNRLWFIKCEVGCGDGAHFVMTDGVLDDTGFDVRGECGSRRRVTSSDVYRIMMRCHPGRTSYLCTQAPCVRSFRCLY